MTNTDSSPLADNLVYEDMLPLSWSPRDGETNAVNHSMVAEHNEHVLRCVNLLGEQIKEKIDEESETESALIRLEAKVNLLLDMVSSLGRARADVPDATQVRLAAGGIEWNCQGQAPVEGDRIWIKLYIDNRVPEAMQLAANVSSVSGAVVCARFEDMEEAVQDQLEKMIFRYHRRMVAQSKSA